MSTHDIVEKTSDGHVETASEVDVFAIYAREVETHPRMTDGEERQVAEEIAKCRHDIVDQLRGLVLEAAEAVGLDEPAAQRLRDELSEPASEKKLEALERRIREVAETARRASEILRRGKRSQTADALRRARRLLAEITGGFGVTPAMLERVAAEVSEKRHRIAAAKQRLVEANLRLVLYFARRMRWRGVDTVDLVQEGNIALLRAADSYDPERGCTFASLACTAIRRAMSRFGSKASPPVHIPSEVRARRQRVRQTERYLTSPEGVPPSWGEIAEYLGVPMAVVIDALYNQEEAVSLDTAIDDERPILSRLVDVNTPDIAESFAVAHADRQVRQTVAGLDARDRQVIESRFDLADRGAATLAEVGREHGVTRERARQLEARALRRLRTRGSAGRRRQPARRCHPSSGTTRAS